MERYGRIWPFLLWLAFFYAAWAWIVFGHGLWGTALDHWPITVAMTAGSYVAGSTPMGGGTIGFPILVLLFDQPAKLGRDFSFAVQSIGMTSASIFILATRQRVVWRVLGWAIVGSSIGTPIGVALVAPLASDVGVKVLFAVVWASFGVMTFAKVREFATYHGMAEISPRLQTNLGLIVGLFGGALVAALTGVGIDMLVYTVLLLIFRADLKISIPTSVILMAATSLIGVLTNVVLASAWPEAYRVDPEVFSNWIAAAPIVALGAPLGAFIVTLVSRTPTLLFVSALCVLQFVWTCYDSRLTGPGLAVAIASVLGANGVFHILYRTGQRLRGEREGTAMPVATE